MGKVSWSRNKKEVSHEDLSKKVMDKIVSKRHRERGSIKSKTLSSNYKAVTGGSAYQNGVLSRIVEQLKSKFLDGEVHPIPFNEILELTSQTEISASIKRWLKTEALPDNPRISVIKHDYYVYKPPLDCWDRKSLVKLFKKKDADGPLGILEDSILASVPYADRVLQELEESDLIFSDVRGDKKKVYFYNGSKPDPEKVMPDAYKKLWKSVFIYGMDDAKIEVELARNGIISSKSAHIVQKIPKPTHRKTPSGRMTIKDNLHVQDLLISYDNFQIS